MLKIRLQRVGRTNIRTFRIVLTDSKNSAKSGRVHEVLGMYDPVNNKKEIDGDRAKYWISKGAKVSDTMHNFLIEKKVISGKKVNALPRKSPMRPEVKEGDKAETPAKAEAPKTEAPVPAPAQATA